MESLFSATCPATAPATQSEADFTSAPLAMIPAAPVPWQRPPCSAAPGCPLRRRWLAPGLASRPLRRRHGRAPAAARLGTLRRLHPTAAAPWARRSTQPGRRQGRPEPARCRCAAARRIPCAARGSEEERAPRPPARARPAPTPCGDVSVGKGLGEVTPNSQHAQLYAPAHKPQHCRAPTRSRHGSHITQTRQPTAPPCTPPDVAPGGAGPQLALRRAHHGSHVAHAVRLRQG